MKFRVKHQRPHSEGSAAASANSSTQLNTRNPQAVAYDRTTAGNSRMLAQLKEHGLNSPLQSAMSNFRSTLPSGRTLSQSLETRQPATGEEGVMQGVLLPLEAFESQFKDNKERKSDTYEYHAQICDDLALYHKYEYDLSKSAAEEIELKYDVRKMALEKIILGCNLWMHYPNGRPPAQGSKTPWNAVANLKKEATIELERYYKNEEGRSALHALLNAKKEQKQEDVYSVDEFKNDASLGLVSSNVGDMGAVLGKLKAFHAIEEKPNDDSTREAKLTTLDAIVQLATVARQSIQETQKRKSYKEGFPGFWQDWHNARVNALNNLILMLLKNRGRYENPIAWKMNLIDLAARTESAAEGTGVSMNDVDTDWVEVDDESPEAKQMAAETDEIVKRLSGGPGQ